MREFIKAYNENKESDPQHFVVIVESRGRWLVGLLRKQ
jgi:hypothetical protein